MIPELMAVTGALLAVSLPCRAPKHRQDHPTERQGRIFSPYGVFPAWLSSEGSWHLHDLAAQPTRGDLELQPLLPPQRGPGHAKPLL